MKRTILCTIILLGLAFPSFSSAGGKVGIYGIYMAPYGVDAKNYSRPGFGGGIHAVVPIPQVYEILAGVAGFEYINLLSESIDDYDYVAGVPFPYTQQTTQGYFRLYLGPEIGPHGNGFVRPHAGFNLALVVYNISTDVVIKDASDPNKDISKNKASNTKVTTGFDLSMGLDLNFSNEIATDIGIRYLKSFSLPQQLGEGAITIYPQYFQVYLGIGISFDKLRAEK